jgi:hypothetical protein
MPATKDWLKHSHEELYDQATITYSYLSNYVNRERMGLGTSTMQGQWYDSNFVPSYTNFQTAFDDWRDPAQRSPLKIETLNDRENEFRPIYRQLYSSFLKASPFVTDEDLISMDMPPRHTGSHPSPVAKKAPEYYDDTSVHRQIGIHIKGAKPEGQHGVEVCWAILDSPPTTIEELTHSSFVTRSPLILSFDENQRGKKVFFCLRWENTRGEKGPWSDIFSAIIP